jgi:hypothetical protein
VGRPPGLGPGKIQPFRLLRPFRLRQPDRAALGFMTGTLFGRRALFDVFNSFIGPGLKRRRSGLSAPDVLNRDCVNHNTWFIDTIAVNDYTEFGYGKG